MGLGVMILGESGMGKSETALDLIRDGQVLISDDRVDVQHIQNSIYGHAPAITKGLLEIRGIGVINVERCSVLLQSQIVLKLNLLYAWCHLKEMRNITVSEMKHNAILRF